MDVKRLDEPNPMTGCVLDHDTIEARQVIGDAGLRWAHCPYCNVQVEARYQSIGPQGVAWGKGRGAITERFERVLGFIAHMANKVEP